MSSRWFYTAAVLLPFIIIGCAPKSEGREVQLGKEFSLAMVKVPGWPVKT